MEPLDITDDPGEGEQIPDRPHVEIMFEALNDTLAGVECKNLSEAQVYAEGVLMATGALRMNTVEGNEGFFSSIGNGAKAIYDYIVKMFKSVWGFFFKRDAVKAADEAKEEVKEKADELKTAGTSSSTPEATEKQWGGLKAFIAEMPEEDRGKLSDYMTLPPKAGVDEKRKAVGQVIKEMPKANKKAQVAYKKSVESLKSTKERFIRIVEAAQAATPATKSQGVVSQFTNSTRMEVVGMAADHAKYEKAFLVLLDRHPEVTSVQDAGTMTTAITSNLDAMKALVKHFNTRTSQVSDEIKWVEKHVATKKAIEGDDTEFGKVQLENLRALLTFTTNVAQAIKKSTDELVKLQTSTNKVFGLR